MAGKNIIVTGAASGIGRACARALLDAGHRVAVLDVAFELLQEEFGGMEGAYIVPLDAGSPASCREAIDMAVKRLGSLNSLIHFAAIWSGITWEKSDESEWNQILAVNLTGSFLIAKAAAQHLIAAGGGSIVMTASASARVGGVAAGPAYASSKGGVISLTRSLARALGPHGIRVNSVNPGVVRSPMTESWPQAIMEQTLARTPLGRIASPEDIADVALFLALDGSRFITGEILEVNGGFYFD